MNADCSVNPLRCSDDPGYGFTGLQRATGMAALRPDELNLRSEEFSSWWRVLTDAIRKQVDDHCRQFRRTTAKLSKDPCTAVALGA